MKEIILAAAIIGFLVFIALTLNSISHDLSRIRKILDDYEHERIESCIKEYIETGKITH